MGRLHYKNEAQKDQSSSSWSLGEVIVIRLWFFVWLFLMSWTPKALNRWRVSLLRLFGAKVHGMPFVFSSARIHVPWNVEFRAGACLGPRSEVYSLGKVVLRERCVVSQEAYLCGGTHDLTSSRQPLMIGEIDVGRDVFIGARAFVLPGVSIGEQAVVGAMAVVANDVAPHQVVAGNPARVVGERMIREG